MKVLNKLQYSIKLSEILQDHLHNPVSVKGINSAIDKYVNKQELSDKFYNQAFKPELITELFEGWEQHKNIEGNVIDWWHEPTSTEHSVPQYEFEYQGEGVIYTGCGGKYIVATMPPKTLDHFITDCQRAGIELTLKPEVINKYFL